MAGKSTRFADRLQELRKAAGLSQYALARKAGLSKQALSHLELGNRGPAWNTVQLLAAALGVSCEAFSDPDVKPPPEGPPAKPGRPRKGNKPAPAPKGGAGVDVSQSDKRGKRKKS